MNLFVLMGGVSALTTFTLGYLSLFVLIYSESLPKKVLTVVGFLISLSLMIAGIALS